MKKIKTLLVLVLIVAAVLSFSSCSKSRMLNEMAVVQAISFDDKDGIVTVGIQYLDLNKGSGINEGLGSSLTSNAVGRGKTSTDAVANLADTLPDNMYTGQAKLIIVGDSFYKNRMPELKNDLLRNPNLRCDLLIARSENALDVLKNGFRNERVPIDGACKELRSAKALVRVNDYLSNNSVRLPVIVNIKGDDKKVGDSAYVVY